MAAPKKSAPKAANADGSLSDNPVKGGAKLDRNKLFYDVHSGGNVKFEQDGKLFNLEGNQVDLDGNLVKGRVSNVSPQSDLGDADPDALTSGSVGATGDEKGDANGGNPDAEKTDGMTEDDLAALGGK